MGPFVAEADPGVDAVVSCRIAYRSSLCRRAAAGLTGCAAEWNVSAACLGNRVRSARLDAVLPRHRIVSNELRPFTAKHAVHQVSVNTLVHLHQALSDLTSRKRTEPRSAS